MRRRELGIRWTLGDCVSQVLVDRAYSATPLTGPRDLLNYLEPWAGEAQEAAVVILIDVRLCILGHREIGRGSASDCPIDIKEVFRAALMGAAYAIILSHNHPSGSVEPSAEDVKVTKRIKVASDLLGIPLLDHVIVGLNAQGRLVHHSMRASGGL